MLRLISVLLVAGLFAQEAKPPAVRVLGAGILQAPSGISRLAISPDSRRLAAGTHREGIVFWDLATLKEVQRIPAAAGITDLRYLSDGTHLIYMTQGTDEKGQATLWDLQKNAMVRSFSTPNNHARFALTPDEKTLLVPDYLAPGVSAWEVGSGREIEGLKEVARAVPDVKYSVQHIAFNGDASLVACIDEVAHVLNGAPHDERSRVTIWDWKTKTLKREWFVDDDQVGWSGDLLWMPDGEHLLLPTWHSGIVVNAADGKVAFTFDGRVVGDYALTQKECVKRDLKTGAKIAGFPLVRPLKGAMTACVSADGRWLAASGSQSVTLIDLKEKVAVAPLIDTYEYQPYSVAYTADGRLLVHDNGLTRVYDDATGHLMARFKAGHTTSNCAECFSSDGRRFFVADAEPGNLEMWDPVRGERLGRLNRKLEGWIVEIFMSPDGKYGATCGQKSGDLQFHDLITGKPMGRVKGPESGLVLNGCEWSAAGDRVYVASPEEGFSGVYDPKTGRLVHAFKDVTRGMALAVSEVANAVYLTTPEFTGLWKATDGTYLRGIDSPGQEARFSSDGKHLIGSDATIDVATGKDEYRFASKERRFVSPSGRLVASFDKELRIFDMKTGKELCRREIDPAGKIARLVWHPAERQVAVTLEGQALVLQIDLPCGDEALAQTVEALRKANEQADPIKLEWK